jgi:mannose-6-phosphate isomerase-like protein (cupin superfamily)
MLLTPQVARPNAGTIRLVWFGEVPCGIFNDASQPLFVEGERLMFAFDPGTIARGTGLVALTALLVLHGSQTAAEGAAQVPPDGITPYYVVWPHALPPEGMPSKIQFKTHAWALAHREKSGNVESHESRAIVMIVQSGEATLVCGNDVVDPRRTASDELRGTSIRNGVSRKVVAGDVINMPAGLPHQFLLEPSKQLTYIDVVIPAK